MAFDYSKIDIINHEQRFDYPKEWKVAVEVEVSFEFTREFEALKILYPDITFLKSYWSGTKFYKIQYSLYTTFVKLLPTFLEIWHGVKSIIEIDITCMTDTWLPTEIIFEKVTDLSINAPIKIRNLKIGTLNLLGTSVYGNSDQVIHFYNCHINKVVCSTAWGCNLRRAFNFDRKTKIAEGEYHYRCGHIFKPGKLLPRNSKYFEWRYIEQLEKEYKMS